MSVTFSVAMGPILGFDIVCVCDARYLTDGEAPMAYEVALATLETLKAAGRGLKNCDPAEDCWAYGLYTEALDDTSACPEVTVANGNVRPVLEALGLAEDNAAFEDICCGGTSGQDFLGRVLMGLAVAPVSAERPTVVNGGPGTGQALFVDCGVDEGYVQSRLAQLRFVAEAAIAMDRDVVWS